MGGGWYECPRERTTKPGLSLGEEAPEKALEGGVLWAAWAEKGEWLRLGPSQRLEEGESRERVGEEGSTATAVGGARGAREMEREERERPLFRGGGRDSPAPGPG